MLSLKRRAAMVTPNHPRRRSHGLLLELLEDRVVPTAPYPGQLVIANSDINGNNSGLLGVDPFSGAQTPISIGGANYHSPAYVSEGPDGTLYVANVGTFSMDNGVPVYNQNSGSIVALSPTDGYNSQTVLASGLNGPYADAFINGYLYAAEGGANKRDFHSLVKIDPSTGQQTTIGGSPSPDNGNVTGATPTTLSNCNANWGNYAGWMVLIVDGTGEGQYRTISSNTTTQLTINGSWTTMPDTTSRYSIGFAVPVGMKAIPGDNSDAYVADEGGGINYPNLGPGEYPGMIWKVSLTTGVETIVTYGDKLTSLKVPHESPYGQFDVFDHRTDDTHYGNMSDMAVDPITGEIIALNTGSAVNPGGSGGPSSLGSLIYVDPNTHVQTNLADPALSGPGLDGVTVAPGPYGPDTIFSASGYTPPGEDTRFGQVAAILAQAPYTQQPLVSPFTDYIRTAGGMISFGGGLTNYVNFETGDFSQLASHIGGAISNSPALDRLYSLRLLRNNSVANAEIRQPNNGYYDLSTAYYSFLFRYTSQTGEGGVVNFQDTSSNYKAAIHLSAAGKLLFYDANGNLVATGTTTLNPNQTYTISAKIGTGSNAPWEVRINGNVELSGTGYLGSIDNGSLLLGGRSPYTTDYYYDDVAISGYGYPGQAPANQTAVEGVSTAINLGSFSDPAPAGSVRTVTVSWGDGTLDTFDTREPESLGTLNHAFAEEGTYQVTVTIQSYNQPLAYSTFWVGVSDPAVNPAFSPFLATVNVPLSNQLVATFTDPGGTESVADYSASIDWGDGTKDMAVPIIQTGSSFEVRGSHTYSQTGTFNLAVAIAHDTAPTSTVLGTITVSPGGDPPTITVVSSSLPTSVAGQSVTFTATVNPQGPGTPTGSVSFYDGSTTLGRIGVSTSGGVTVALLTTGTLGAGSHAITARYNGDSNFTASGSAAITQSVSWASTSTSVNSLVNPSAFGQPVAFTATVRVAYPGSIVPSGTVVFWDGSTSIGQGTLSPAGSAAQATFSTSSLANGTHTITASYSGDTNFVTSTSPGTLTQTVNSSSTTTTTTVTSSGSPSVSGETVTFTVTVTASNATTPTGTVVFNDNGKSLGSATLSNSGGTATAIFRDVGLTVGRHTITVNYLGSNGYASSIGTLVGGQMVNRAYTTMQLATSGSSSTYGQAVTFTAVMSILTPGSAAVAYPTGTVIFTDNGSSFGQGTLSTSGGVTTASYSTSSLLIGSHTIMASYSGDGNFVNSAASLTQSVNPSSSQSTSLWLGSSASPSVYGQPVTLAAYAMWTNGSATPTGTVAFFEGPKLLGQGTLFIAPGPNQVPFDMAILTVSNWAVGPHLIAAVYSGDAHFTGSTSNLLSQNVTAASGTGPTTTNVAMSLDPALAGQPVTFTATVHPTNSSSYVPTGTVQFQADGVNVGGPVVISNSGGQITATFTTSALAAGTHSITASYGGDRNFASSSGTLAGGQTITTGMTSTTLSLASSVAPSVFGQTVTVAAAILANSLDMPTGMVTFYDGSTLLGQAVVGSSNGLAMASFSTPSLAVGAHTITASYGGDSNFAASSGTLAGGQTVNMASTSTAVSASANPSSVGEMISFTATINAVGTGSTQGGVPTGMVTFFDGSTTLGQAPLSTAGGITTASFSTASLSAGSHSITASYAGDGSFLASSGTWTQMVSTSSTVSTTTTVTAPVTAARYGQQVTFTATVSLTVPPSTAVGYPTGTMTFYDNGTSLGQATVSTASGVTTASFTASLLTSGTQTITATYSGDAIFVSSNGTLAGGLTVSSTGSTPTTTQVTTSSSTVQAGQSVTLTATVSPFSYLVPTGTVQFQVDGVNFAAPVALSSSGSSAVATLTTSALPVGTHTITARYNGDNTYAASTGRMWGSQTVTAPPIRGDVTTSLDASGTLTLTVAAGGGFTVTQDPQGNLLVTGDASTINGSTAPASFNAVSAIMISLANGNNDVTLSGLSIPGSIFLSAGSGADSITLSGVTVGNAGTPSGNTIPGSIVLSAGSGADNFTLSGITADVLTLGATGPDSVSLSNLKTRNDLNITVGPGSQAVSVLNTACLDLTIQAQSSANDNLNINLESDTVTHTTQGGLTIDDAGTGIDTVTLNNSQNGLSVGYELAVMLSSGSNSLSAAQVTTLFGTVDGGCSGNNSYLGQGSNQGYALYDFLGH